MAPTLMRLKSHCTSHPSPATSSSRPFSARALTKPFYVAAQEKAPSSRSRKGPFRGFIRPSLERILQPELDRTTAKHRSVFIVVLIANQVIARSEQIRMVECVEKFRAKFKRLVFESVVWNGEPAANACVEEPLAGTINRVAAWGGRSEAVHKGRDNETESVRRLGSAWPGIAKETGTQREKCARNGGQTKLRSVDSR